MKYIRSMQTYDERYVIIKKTEEKDNSGNIISTKVDVKRNPETGEPVEVILLGRQWQNKNITAVQDDEWEFMLKHFEQVQMLVEKRVFQVLDDMPQTYWNAQELASRNASLLQQSENEKKVYQEISAKKDETISALVQKLKDAGIELKPGDLDPKPVVLDPVQPKKRNKK